MLLRDKRSHLVARQDIYEADPAELRLRSGRLRMGREAFRDMLRNERLRRVEEACAIRAAIPDGEVAPAGAVRAVLADVERLYAAHRKDGDLDPRGERIRDALMETLALCVAWLAAIGYESADTIAGNIAMAGTDRLRPTVGSRLWATLTGYYVDELQRESPEQLREMLLFGLGGLLVEEIWRLDEYWPEDEDD